MLSKEFKKDIRFSSFLRRFAALSAAALFLILFFAGCSRQAAAAPEATLSPSPSPTPTQAPVILLDIPTCEESPTSDLTPIPTPTDTPTPVPTPVPEPTDTPEPTPTPLPLTGIVIGIDPGHQLVYNPSGEPVAPNSRELKEKTAGGCRGIRSGVYEYEVALNVGLYLRDYLREAGATVIMTHEVLDVDLSNIDRAKIFNDASVDLGIRLHCNKADDRKMRGAFMIVPIESRTNYYEFIVNSAKTIFAAYIAETGLPVRFREGMTFRGDQTGFNWCTRPIMTIEMGHLTNPEEDALLSKDEFQQKMAYGLFRGIMNVFVPDHESGVSPSSQ